MPRKAFKQRHLDNAEVITSYGHALKTWRWLILPILRWLILPLLMLLIKLLAPTAVAAVLMEWLSKIK